MPFNALPGLGEAAAQSIVDAREQSPFISIEDLRNRTKISASLIDLLREGGCLGQSAGKQSDDAVFLLTRVQIGRNLSL